jgi:molybdopterin biosynthesis enzyme MoaB
MSGIKAGILTASDRCSAGINTDMSGMTIEDILRSRMDAEITCYKLVPDEREVIAEALKEMSDVMGIDLILTTGGTGFSKGMSHRKPQWM